MDTEAFITEILNRPPIWMSKHPQHKYKNVIKRLWEEIKQCFLEYDVAYLKKKWKNLKDAYRKELKKIPSSRSGDRGPDDEDFMPQWKYFSLMTFLKEEYMPAENESNLTEREDLDASSQSEFQSTLSPPSPSETPRFNEVSMSPQPSTSHSEIPDFSRKRKLTDIRAEYLEIEKKKLKILEQEVKKNQSTPDIEKSEDYHYLMSILPEMQKLNSIQKMRVRNKINQVLMDELLLNMYGDTSRGYYTQPPPATNIGTDYSPYGTD